MQTNMHEAKSKLSQLVELALTGEEVVIARAGKPAVKLVPFKNQKNGCLDNSKGKLLHLTTLTQKRLMTI